jgi:flavin reductase (DIM6/NTAB) family NADH-FMN oxidoreductase RutF
MERRSIPIKKFMVRPHYLWSEKWFLLTSGDFKEKYYNTMTVAWGSFGTMWNKPFVQVVVRPTRYTYKFMEKYDTFSLCAFSERYRDSLMVMGTKSGRDGDKIAETGLIPIPLEQIQSPGFDEAELIIECRKIYWQDFDPNQFLDHSIHKNYPEKDYHRVYYGEIVQVNGKDDYSF